MAQDLNSCTFTGRVTRDPWTKEGDPFVAKFTLACNGRNDQVAWLDFTAFGPLAEKVVAPYVTQGRQLSVVARAETRKVDTPEGPRTQTSFIVNDLVLGPAKGEGGGQAAAPAQADDQGW